MKKLVFSLSQAKQAGGYTVERELSETDLRPVGVQESALSSVKVSGKLTAMENEVLFRGTMVGTYEQPCDRCLDPASRTVEQSVVWYFEPGVEPNPLVELRADEIESGYEEDIEGERVRFYEGEEINLGPHVWEEMLLAAPTKYYCRDNCKGLCPGCGSNLNEGACSCAPETETGNSGLAGLKDMFPNLPSQETEE